MYTEKILRWRKTTKGRHYHNGIAGKQVVMFNEILKATASELSSPIIRRQFVCVDNASLNDPSADMGNMLKIVPDEKNPGKFNIVNPVTEKVINDSPMELKKAEDVSGVSYEGKKEPEKKEEKKPKMKSKKIISKKATTKQAKK